MATPRPEFNGFLLRDPASEAIYLIIDGLKCHVPDQLTCNNLFGLSGNDMLQIVTEVVDVNDVSDGLQLTPGAILALRTFNDGSTDQSTYLISDAGSESQVKRYIPSPAIMGKYHFNQATYNGTIKPILSFILDFIPSGTDLA